MVHIGSEGVVPNGESEVNDSGRISVWRSRITADDLVQCPKTLHRNVNSLTVEQIVSFNEPNNTLMGAPFLVMRRRSVPNENPRPVLGECG